LVSSCLTPGKRRATQLPCPPRDQPQNLTSELYTDSRWQATCRTEGYVNYNFTIATIEPGNNGDAKVRGYYKWDPRIEITYS